VRLYKSEAWKHQDILHYMNECECIVVWLCLLQGVRSPVKRVMTEPRHEAREGVSEW